MNFILIILIINYLLNFIFKPKTSSLYCGIFGWAGISTKTFSMASFNLLGKENEERGKHSCGLAIDNVIKTGTTASTKLFSDFAKIGHENPVKVPIVLGHTRMASVGAINSFNAHPLGFGHYEKGFRFIGIHNGTLYNYKDLAEKYNIKLESTYKNVNNVQEKREKIDSEILLECIYRSRSSNVLGEYFGKAALAFYDCKEPNVLYLFKGASKLYADTKSQVYYEERPLYVYKQNKNSMYFSSLKEPLKLIGGNKDNIIDVETNVLYKIKNGNFDSAIKYEIDRTKCYSEKAVKYFQPRHNRRWPAEDYAYDVWDDYPENPNAPIIPELPAHKKEGKTSRVDFYKNTNKNINKKKPVNNKPVVYNIRKEETRLEQNEYAGYPYFKNLRYYRNGHLISDGYYIYVKGCGFYYLGFSRKDSEKEFWNSCFDKPYNKDERRFIKSADRMSNAYVPFPQSKGKVYGTEGIPVYTFFNGIMLKDPSDYDYFIRNYGDKTDAELNLDPKIISEASAHPIIQRKGHSEEIYYNNKLYSGTITMLGSDRRYIILKGKLVRWIDIEKIQDAEFYAEKESPETYNNLLEEDNVKNDKETKVISLHDSDVEKEENDSKSEKLSNDLKVVQAVEDGIMSLWSVTPVVRNSLISLGIDTKSVKNFVALIDLIDDSLQEINNELVKNYKKKDEDKRIKN